MRANEVRKKLFRLASSRLDFVGPLLLLKANCCFCCSVCHGCEIKVWEISARVPYFYGFEFSNIVWIFLKTKNASTFFGEFNARTLLSSRDRIMMMPPDYRSLISRPAQVFLADWLLQCIWVAVWCTPDLGQLPVCKGKDMAG